MKAPAIELAGRAGVAAPAAPTLNRRWHALLGALLLALAPATAGAAEAEEWPTASDRGPRTPTRIPWMTFSGDPNAPVVVPGSVVDGRQVVVVREREPTRRERRLMRRADRLAEKAARLRAKAGTRDRRYAVVVPVVPVQVAAPASPPRTVVVEHRRPKVQVVHLEAGHAHDGCDDDHEEADEREAIVERHVPVVIDGERISADVERQVARALRDAEKARARAEREAERAERRSRR